MCSSDLPNGPYYARIYVSIPGTNTLSSAYSMTLADNATATDFVTAWAAAGAPFTTATVLDTGQIQLSHTEGGVIVVDDTYTSGGNKGKSTGLMVDAGFVIGTTLGVKEGTPVSQLFTPATVATTGNYANLTGTPTIPTNTNQLVNGNGFITSASLTWGNVTGKPSIPATLLNLGITDGTNGQVLTTNGAGGFTFTTVSSGSNYGNTNVAAYLAGNITAGNLQLGSTFTFHGLDNSIATTNGSAVQINNRLKDRKSTRLNSSHT